MWTVKVHGLPAPKGSMRCVGRGGRHQLIADNRDAAKDWHARVVSAGRALRQEIPAPLTGPVMLELVFRLPRPRTVKRLWPTARMDSDKLARAVCDAFTDAQVWGDDGQVVILHVIKHYADGEPTGLTARVGLVASSPEEYA